VPRQIYLFDPPERFVAGTVGQPGERTFFLQARRKDRLVSVALEKVQVAVLAERLDSLLEEVRRRGGATAEASAPADLEDVEPLETPLFEEFRVGTMALGWDGNDGRVVIEAHAVRPDEAESAEPPDDDDENASDVLRVRLRPPAARAFARRAARVVAAGRPPCPLCGQPLDAEGHICPRQNGHRR
jgi:uncharacterized repeat protein (TIGR03847 family)